MIEAKVICMAESEPETATPKLGRRVLIFLPHPSQASSSLDLDSIPFFAPEGMMRAPRRVWKEG